MVGRPSRWSGSGSRTLPEVQKWSGDPPGCLNVVGSSSRRCKTGRETFAEVRKWSGDPPEGAKPVGRPSQKSGSKSGALPEV